MALDELLAVDPADLTRLPGPELYAIPQADVERYQLAAVRARFEQLHESVPFLRRLATNQQLERIDSLDDVVPLFFQPTVFKSYPLAMLENARFDRLTSWLDQLTSHDLSDVDVSGCETIDSWLTRLDETSPMRVVHAVAEGGKLTFVPRSNLEEPAGVQSFYQFHQGIGTELSVDFPGTRMPIVFWGYRHGFTPAHRRLEEEIIQVAGGEDSCVCLYPYRLSADVLSLAGRLQAAERSGDTAHLKVNPSVLAQREQYAQVVADRRSHIEVFLKRVTTELGGAACLGMGTWSNVYETMLVAEELGISGVFDPESPINPGGAFGQRGDVPADWYERICRFLGLETIASTYGLTELLPYLRSCSHSHYHFPPYLVPYVLDPDTSEPAPRTGTTTGRFAFVDLLAQTYWGGFVTGDQVTVTWDVDCGCGRLGPYLHAEILAYSQMRGGDDKISCARVDDAHDRALELLKGTI